jgi:DinB superfamily
MTVTNVEPWLRGTLTEMDPLRRGVVHALWMASEDVARWCVGLSDVDMEARPFGLPTVAFQMRHMVRSLDRLLTYAEGRQLSEGQMAALASEMAAAESREALFAEFEGGMRFAEDRVMAFLPGSYAEVRGVGRKMLPTTVGGLLVHCAEHTQRHAGQMVTTAKVVMGTRAG